MSKNIYKEALLNRVRFSTNVGLLTLEEVMDLPLTSKSGLSVDSLAVDLVNKLKNENKEIVSLVNEDKEDIERYVDELKLEVLKDIIEYKKALIEEKRKTQAENSEKRRIMEALARKKEDKYNDMSIEELEELSKKF
ncbi:MAG: hypothetical protein ACTTKY_00035 [Catonella sp.]